MLIRHAESNASKRENTSASNVKRGDHIELNRKHIAIVLVVLFIGSVMTAGFAIAQAPSSQQSTAATGAAGTFQIAPVNPEWTAYMNAKAAGRIVTETPDGKGLGLIPTTVDLSRLNLGKASDYAGAYPAKYDLRSYGWVSPVEGQIGPNCWIFATYGSLESNLLKQGSSMRFSERHLDNFNGFDGGCGLPGQWMMSTAYLTRWGTTMKYYNGLTVKGGPVNLTCDPGVAPSYWCNDATKCPIVKHVTNVIVLPLRTSSLDNNAIKFGLKNFGALDVGMNWQGEYMSKTAYYNKTTAAYYNPSLGGNHAVTVVGWDDNFPASYFSTRPLGNGAFIVKNSWGTIFGKSGYCYVSYYDKSFGRGSNSNVAVAFVAQPTYGTTTTYFYDLLGWDETLSSGTSTAWGANVYTAAKTGTLKSVGFYAPSKNTAYTVLVYKNPSGNNPRGGTLAAIVSGHATYVGYYTASIPWVSLAAGQKFSVVIKYNTPGPTWNIPISYRSGHYSMNAPYSVPGRSFISKTGTAGSWTDLAVLYSPRNGIANCIHAFAS